MKKLKNDCVIIYDGLKARVTSDKKEDDKLADLLKIFLRAIPTDESKKFNLYQSMEDTRRARGVYESLCKADGYIDLENADFDWLNKKFEQFAPLVFGLSTDYIADAMKPMQELTDLDREKKV